jgi:galactose mutarotase-like enzyme
VRSEVAPTATMFRVGTSSDGADFDLADGARVTSLRLGGTELLVPRADRDSLWWGAFVMAPWTGDLPDAEFSFGGRTWPVPKDGAQASHGIARKLVWTGADGVLSARLAGTWPFGGVVEARPAIAAGTFRLGLSMVAEQAATPAAVGWHPWFPLRLPGSGPVEVSLPAGTRQLIRDDRGRPTAQFGELGPPPYNETLSVAGPVYLEWPGAGRLRIAFDSAMATVFSAHPQGVCVEPVTSPAGRMDDVLAPGQRLDLGIDLTWAPAAAGPREEGTTSPPG